jgi:membrane-associated phospholipid phosphatase
MTVAVDAPVRNRADLVARIATEAFAPAVLVAGLMLVVGWHAGDQAGVSRWWGLPGALFAAGIPLAYIVRGVRKGRYSDHHIPEREHRRVPLLFGIASVVVGLALLVVLEAPRDVLALLAAGAAGLVVFGSVTYWWKISIHAGVAAGTVAVLVAVYGPVALASAPLVPLICWARVRLTAHTTLQVVVGAGLGALVAATIFSSLR